MPPFNSGGPFSKGDSTSTARFEAGIFQRGPLSPKHEVGVRYFHDRVRQAMAREGIVEEEWVR
jgi:hypothetical protein